MVLPGHEFGSGEIVGRRLLNLKLKVSLFALKGPLQISPGQSGAAIAA